MITVTVTVTGSLMKADSPPNCCQLSDSGNTFSL